MATQMHVMNIRIDHQGFSPAIEKNALTAPRVPARMPRNFP
jgi:hypothetical protein